MEVSKGHIQCFLKLTENYFQLKANFDYILCSVVFYTSCSTIVITPKLHDFHKHVMFVLVAC